MLVKHFQGHHLFWDTVYITKLFDHIAVPLF